MNIYGICKSCHNHLYFNLKVGSRTALSNEIGSQSKINCERCGVTTTFTVNDLKAKLPKKISHAIIESIVVAIIISIFIYLINLTLLYTLLTVSIYTILVTIHISYTRKNYASILSFNEKKI